MVSSITDVAQTREGNQEMTDHIKTSSIGADYVFKICVIGDSGTGKTQLVSRYLDDEFAAESEPTAGVDCSACLVKMRNHNIALQIWDFSGKDDFRSLSKTCYQGAVGALVVYDVARVRTFDRAAEWIENFRRHAPRFADRELGCPATMLVGNKQDRRRARSVCTQVGAELARRHGAFFVETSAADGTNVARAFDTLVEFLYERVMRAEAVRACELGAGLERGAGSLQGLAPVATSSGGAVVQKPPASCQSHARVVRQRCASRAKEFAHSKFSCCFL